jgi:hypothetical protein
MARHAMKMESNPTPPPSSTSERPEWEVRAERKLINKLCACGRPAQNGVICNACRASNEPED